MRHHSDHPPSTTSSAAIMLQQTLSAIHRVERIQLWSFVFRILCRSVVFVSLRSSKWSEHCGWWHQRLDDTYQQPKEGEEYKNTATNWRKKYDIIIIILATVANVWWGENLWCLCLLISMSSPPTTTTTAYVVHDAMPYGSTRSTVVNISILLSHIVFGKLLHFTSLSISLWLFRI